MSEEKKNNILLGAGELYIVPESVDLENDTEEDIAEALILIGESSGEASLITEQEFVKVRGGRGHKILASIRTEENITFNAGIATLELENLSKIMAGDFTKTEDKRQLKLGGDYTVPVNALRFIHYKAQDDKRLIIDMYSAINEKGLTMNFNATEHSVFDLEFTLMKAAGKDNIVTITEEI